MNNAYDTLFNQAGRQYGVDPRLLKTVFHIESSGNPNTRDSVQGAQGGMQIMPANARAWGIDPHDMTQAVPAAARYLAEGLDATGSPEGALAYYHGGPDRSEWGPKTAAYVDKGRAFYPKVTLASADAPTGGSSVRRAFEAADSASVAQPPKSAGSSIRAAFDAAEPVSQPTLEQPDPNARTGVQDDLGRNVPNIFAPQPPPKPAAPTINQPAPPIVGDHGEVLAPAAPDNTPVSAKPLAQAVATGAANGFGSTPIGMSDQTAQALREAGIFPDPATGRGGPLRAVNEAVIRPLAAAGDLALRGGSAAFGAYQAGVAKLGDMLGAPVLGRDLAAMPEAFMGQPGGLGMPRANPLVPERGIVAERAPAADIPAPEAALPAPPPTNSLTAIPGVNAPAFVPPGANVPKLDRILELIRADDAVKASRPDFVPPDAVQPPNPLATPAPRTVPAASTNALMPQAPAPNSVGAAASAVGESNMSPALSQAYRSVAEGQKLNEPQPVGRDTNRYIPGVEPTAAAMEQSANVSREQKMLESAIPDDFKETAKLHNEARQEYFNGIAGSDVDVQNAKDARSAQAERDLTTTWRNKTEADAAPVLRAAQSILASPDGKRPIVRNAVASVTKELQDGDGLVTDPELLYGVRKHLDDLMSKEAAADDPKSVRAAASLQQMKTALDGVIEQAAPGFQQYLKNFSDASRPIDAIEALQKHENKLYDTQGRMQLSRVQGMMKNIVDSRASPGLNPYKSIPDETMEKLWALRDDLRRVASADELARAKGSDTAQNFMDMAKGAARLGGSMVAHGAANAVAPVYGSLMLNAARGVMGNVKAASAEKKMRQRAANMLHPDPAKYPPPSNALLP